MHYILRNNATGKEEIATIEEYELFKDNPIFKTNFTAVPVKEKENPTPKAVKDILKETPTKVNLSE